MFILRDYKGREHSVIEIGKRYTILECLKTGDRLRVLSDDKWFYKGGKNV